MKPISVRKSVRRESQMPSCWAATFLSLFLLMLCWTAPLWAVITNDQCLECHQEKGFAKEVGGKQVSLYVDSGVLASSVHGQRRCVDCHSDVTDLPHSENLKPASCGKCHQPESRALSSGGHARLPEGCATCHGTHDIKVISRLAEPEAKAMSRLRCLGCHADKEEQTVHAAAKVREDRTRPDCGTCHNPHAASLPQPASQGAACGKCHEDKLAELKRSVHAASEVAGTPNCIACHREHQAKAGQPKDRAATLLRFIAECRKCHEKESQSYLASIHGRKLIEGNPDVPSCGTCHGRHGTLSNKDPASPVFHNNIVRLCTSCHEDKKLTAKYAAMPKPVVLKAYEQSVHGQALSRQGLMVAPTCTDCHGTHDLEPADDPTSHVAKGAIPRTCGRCHGKILDVYQESVHGKAFSSGITDAPVCTDCHGEHTITAHTEEGSSVSARNIPRTCAACHAAERIATKYNLPVNRYATYESSFHGVANKYGTATVANCASCHGYHDIRPPSDTLSSVNPRNLPATCGKCHPGAGANFARGKVHIEATRQSAFGVYLVRRFYIWFIGILGAAFLLHILLDILGARRRAQQSGEPKP
jgi:hypothetical protein